MALTASDIVLYGSVNMQEDDVATPQGGAIDTTIRVVFTDIVATDIVEAISTQPGDSSQTLTVYGRNAGGSIVNEALSLNGIIPVTGSTSFERILKADISGTGPTGIVTLRDDATIMRFETGVTEIRRPFYNVSADASGGAAKIFYEKIHVKNNNTVSSLLTPFAKESGDGTEAVGADITFDLETGLGAPDTGNTSTNRITAPNVTGMSSGVFNDTNKAFPADLGAADTLGIWLKLDLPAGTVATNTTYTLSISGSTA